MTKEQAIAAQLPVDTFNIVSGKKKLGSVQYRAWQDGGVFLLRGRFPLDIFLVFLNQVVPGLSAGDMQYFRGNDLQVSFVLPVTHRQFLQTLQVFEQRSANMAIQREESKFVVQQIADEGSASPFVARLMISVFGIRDAVYDQKNERNRFDDLYDPVLSGLRSTREAERDIAKAWHEHKAKIDSGAVVQINGRRVQISASIDRELKRDLESLLNSAVRTIKHNLQTLIRDLGDEIGFLFQKEPAFRAGVLKTRLSDPALADYLLAARLWTEPLVLTRNDLEHGSISSPEVAYAVDRTTVRVEEPQFCGKPVTQFTSDVLDRVCCFAEELVVHSLRKHLPVGFDITEVSIAERDPSIPERFQVTVKPGGRPRWGLTPHTNKFHDM
jgi:hypothetical protein